MIYAARDRAKLNGLPFDLVVTDIRIPEECPLLGIPLVYGKRIGAISANSPTLDRRDNARGYVRGNVWVISWRANRLKADATLEELERLVAGWRANTP